MSQLFNVAAETNILFSGVSALKQTGGFPAEVKNERVKSDKMNGNYRRLVRSEEGENCLWSHSG